MLERLVNARTSSELLDIAQMDGIDDNYDDVSVTSFDFHFTNLCEYVNDSRNCIHRSFCFLGQLLNFYDLASKL